MYMATTPKHLSTLVHLKVYRTLGEGGLTDANGVALADAEGAAQPAGATIAAPPTTDGAPPAPSARFEDLSTIVVSFGEAWQICGDLWRLFVYCDITMTHKQVHVTFIMPSCNTPRSSFIFSKFG